MDNSFERIPTKGSHLKNNDNFEVVIFSKKKKTKRKPHVSNTVENNLNCPEFDVKKATKEIIKLGAKGFYQRRRDKTLKTLAVELGAKPEKSRYHNYKELKEIKQMQKERKERHLNMLKESSNLSALNHYRKHAQKVKKKTDINILNSYGKRK